MKRIISLLLCALCLFNVGFTPAIAEENSEQTVLLENLGIPTQGYIADNSQYLFGRSVWDITAYDGRIYIGCGDYDKNTGNALGGTPIYSYSPASGEWVREATVADEQISRYFHAWGTLFIAGTDPVSGSDGQFFALTDGTWTTTRNVLYGTHMFDMLFANDGKTAFAGLGTNYAVPPTVSMTINGGKVFRSVRFRKNGENITASSLSMGGTVDTSTVYCRVYNLFEYEGDIYATVWANNSKVHEAYAGLYRYNAAERIFDYYCDTPRSLYRYSMYSSYDAVFNGTFVSAYNTLTVFSEDLKSWKDVTGFTGSASCIRVLGDHLYMTTYEPMTNGGFITRLYRTADLKDFELLTSFEHGSYASSFCYYDGVFYLGTSSGRGQPTAQTGTVFALTLLDEACTHENMITDVRLATEAIPGIYLESCPDCGSSLYRASFPFTDVEDKWYLPSVIRANQEGLMNGTGAITFNPNGTTTRAQLVTVLYNLENKPEVDTASLPFTDVASDRYYTSPIAWAYANEIVNGTSDTAFNPNGQITREQFAAILYRYAQYKGQDVSARAELSAYTDQDRISSYAKEPLSWANAEGYITGTSATVINPKGGATRAQMATILIRYLDNID